MRIMRIRIRVIIPLLSMMFLIFNGTNSDQKNGKEKGKGWDLVVVMEYLQN